MFSNVEKEKTYLKDDTDLTEIGIHSIAMLSFVFSVENKVVAGEWDEKYQKKTQLTFTGLLTQITNGLIGILKTVEIGLDYQARVLLRNVIELFGLSMCLFMIQTG